MSKARKLWIEASDSFCLAVHGEKSGGGKVSAPGMRVMFWPTGRICWQANMYLVALRKRGLATTTVNTYCSDLSKLLRFLHQADLGIEQMHDEHLIAYADYVMRPSCGRGASANHANRLVLRAIDFLSWLQLRVPTAHLVGADGECAQISLTIRRVRNRRGASQVHHPALVAPNIRRQVRPITSEVIRDLQGACRTTAKSEFVIARNIAILKMLADSGIRREELVWLRAMDIGRAIDLGGRLEVRTAKRRGNPIRQVPVPVDTLKAIRVFLEVHRRLQIRRIAKRDRAFKDAGWAFCTRSGGQLAAASVTQIISDLREGAGLEQRATAHMFRHRWITLQMVQRLKALQSSHPHGLQLMTTLLSRLASITGHASIDSLWTYVDWAFDEGRVAPPAFSMTGDQSQHVSALAGLLAEILSALPERSNFEGLRSKVEEFQKRLDVEHAPSGSIGIETVASHSLRREVRW
uniref:Uncharacterized protein n=1 Tax=Curvibacter symbiont subsp. Hydra magnipapillata TaxID=667019 RepID=C9YBY1_CURXX|nr:hypothetical protein Csp_C22100 [Curvibacter putative symbiont of Hydra magnipapillata]